MRIGYHAGFSPHLEKNTLKKLTNDIKEIKNDGADCFQFFSRSPQAPPVYSKFNDVIANTLDQILKKEDVIPVIHTAYTLNFCKEFDQNSRWIKVLIDELKLAGKIHALGCVLHFGKYTTLPKNLGIHNMVTSLISVLKQTPKLKSKIILETPSGEGTEICFNLDDMSEFYHAIPRRYRKRIGFCVDTCHIFSGGVDLRDPQETAKYFKKFDQLIGLKNLLMVHFNDSATKFNSHIDRHASIGRGHIGKKRLKYVFKNLHKYQIPAILETDDIDHDIKILVKWKKEYDDAKND